MNYLSISRATTHIAYAIFKNELLLEYDTINFVEFEQHKRMKELFDKLKSIILDRKIGVVITKDIDLKTIKKDELKRIFEVRAIIQLATAECKAFYYEPKSDGWELYITQGRNTLRKKLEIVNKGYELELVFNKTSFYNGQQEIADAIILGEAVAHGRLHA